MDIPEYDDDGIDGNDDVGDLEIRCSLSEQTLLR